MSVRSFAVEEVHRYRGVHFRDRAALPLVSASLVDQAQRRGDQPFLTAEAPDGQSCTVSYHELDQASARIAGWLQQKLGLRAGDVVGFVATNDANSVLTLFALLRAGIRALMLSPSDPPARLNEQLGVLGARTVLVTRPDPAHRLENAVCVPDAQRLPPTTSAVDHASRAADVALYFGTSGSTAASKLVAQAHYNMAANARAMQLHHRLVPGDRLLACLPLHHVNCLHLTIVGAFASGAHVYLAPRFDLFQYARILRAFEPKIASVVPSILEALSSTWRSEPLPESFRYFISAASPLSAQTAAVVRQKLGARIVQGYGLTETTNFSTTLPTDLSAAQLALIERAAQPSIGVAVDGNEVAVLDSDGVPLPPGEVGEVCVRGHNVMLGYAENPEATAEAFRGGWFHTQDLGFYRQHEGQDYFFITGRSKNIAKVGGESVSLEELERVLRSVPGMLDAACLSMPHRLHGDLIWAALVWPAEAPEPDYAPVLRGHFSAAARPRRFIRVDAVPRSPTGKILRPKLAELLTTKVAEAR